MWEASLEIKNRKKMRLDQLLVHQGLAESRNKAQALILAGQVQVFHPLTQHLYPTKNLKPGTLIFENSSVKIKSGPKYVSRGGDKLEGALNHWGIKVSGEVCLDIGASTGGFSDCLLQNGAQEIYAMDVGHGQLHPKLRNDPRVHVYEKSHILRWEGPWINGGNQHPAPSFTTIDVSFISLSNVLQKTFQLLGSGARVLALIKPQFEVGPKNIKKGIVTDDEVRASSIDKIVLEAEAIGFKVIGHFICPVSGAKGNREEWLYLNR